MLFYCFPTLMLQNDMLMHETKFGLLHFAIASKYAKSKERISSSENVLTNIIIIISIMSAVVYIKDRVLGWHNERTHYIIMEYYYSCIK